MAPVDNSPPINTGPFKLSNAAHAYGKIPIYEYQSIDTGLTVILAEVEGPIVNGYLCLATEAFDDDGLPHTLEHLVFLGSEEYPYKGILDLLANRCLASGTNAWTDTDHTCYTLETAGSEGFLTLLPIYLDHILYPTLTDESFVTEVHHITGEGHDAGVVYCEMQGRENSAESKLYLELIRSIYPGHCGYSSETGGIMKNLRESTSNIKVRNYHKNFYRPENLKIIVIGKITHESLFKALEPIEKKIIAKGKLDEPFVKPWQTPVPTLEESKDLKVYYPLNEETHGLYCMGWRGPSYIDNHYIFDALKILMKYLTKHSNYILPQEFVEIKDPYASYVSSNYICSSESCFYITLDNVPLNKMSELKPKLQNVFERIVKNEDLNMERMQDILKCNILEHKGALERDPQHVLCYMIIGYVLYGDTKKDLEIRTDPLPRITKLLQEPKSFWLNLIKTYLIDNSYVSIECIPSIKEYETLSENEAERVKKQREALGESGLKEKKEILEAAINFNEKSAPESLLTSVEIPNISSINFHSISRYGTDLDKKDKIDLTPASLVTYFDDIKSEFVYMYVLIDTTSLEDQSRIYIPLLTECLFDSDLEIDGIIVPYDKVLDEMNKDVITCSTNLGVGPSQGLFKCSPFANTITGMVQVEISKFAEGIKWLSKNIYQIAFTIERLRVIATRMLNAASQIKRSGRDMAHYAVKAMQFSSKSNTMNNSLLRQTHFLTEVIRILNSDNAEKFVKKCDAIWKSIVNSQNVSLHFLGDIAKISNPVITLNQFLPKDMPGNKTRNPITPDYLTLSPIESHKIQRSIIGMACLDSSFLYLTTHSLKKFDDPDLAALLLYMNYLTQTEGPMWKKIRGKGYSYNYSLRLKPNEGLLYLIFAKATNVFGAFKETYDLLKDLLSNLNWDQTLIDSAKSSLIFSIIDEEKTIGNIVDLAVMSYFKMVDYDYNRILLEKIQKVSIEDLKRVGEKYVTALFDESMVRVAVMVNPSKIEEIKDSFSTLNLDLTTYNSLEDSFLCTNNHDFNLE